jgi:hypothetical protein
MARDGKRNRTNKLYAIWLREKANGLTTLNFHQWLKERGEE